MHKLFTRQHEAGATPCSFSNAQPRVKESFPTRLVNCESVSIPTRASGGAHCTGMAAKIGAVPFVILAALCLKHHPRPAATS